jgi:hypothetical protein
MQRNPNLHGQNPLAFDGAYHLLDPLRDLRGRPPTDSYHGSKSPRHGYRCQYVADAVTRTFVQYQWNKTSFLRHYILRRSLEWDHRDHLPKTELQLLPNSRSQLPLQLRRRTMTHPGMRHQGISHSRKRRATKVGFSSIVSTLVVRVPP